MKDGRYYAGLCLNVLLPVLELLLVCLLGPKLVAFFMPFLIGWVIAAVANPLVQLLERHLKILRRHSSVVIVVGVLALVIGLTYLLLSRLISQAHSWMKSLPELYLRVSREADAVLYRFGHIYRMLPPHVQESLSSISGSIEEAVSLLVQTLASPTVEAAGSIARSLPAVLVNVVVVVLSSYFFIAERERLMALLRRLLPHSVSGYFHYLKKEAVRLVGGYFLAQLKIMGVVAVILFAGFSVLGISYALFLALLVAFLDFLPILGTGTVLIPWAVYQAAVGNYRLAAGLIVIYVLTQVVRQLIQPKIVGDTLKLDPLLTLLFLYLGFKFRGISGMIIAVPAGMFFLSLYQFGAFNSAVSSAKELAAEVRALRKAAEETGGVQAPGKDGRKRWRK